MSLRNPNCGASRNQSSEDDVIKYQKLYQNALENLYKAHEKHYYQEIVPEHLRNEKTEATPHQDLHSILQFPAKYAPTTTSVLQLRMVKIFTTSLLLAVIAVGTLKTHANTSGASTLPELNIITPSTPPEAIPESDKASSLFNSASASSTSSFSSASASPTRSGSSSSQSLGSNDAGYANTFNLLVIKGNRFFDSATGDYFAIRGVNYYPRPNTGPLDKNNLDLFSDDFQHIWQRDLPQFTALGANVIRLYSVDPNVDHSAFMCALQAEGIYVVVDLGSNCKGCEITADAAPACYPASYKSRGEKIIKQFARYDNVMAFSGGNEINHRTGGNPWTWNAPCQKKFIRDMRAFMQSCSNLRQVPMGLVVADTDRDDNAQYYNCRTDASDELENAQCARSTTPSS
ncbi:unnamed protein product [Phytophthora lilii]|uniref:Unnamed protein product n=1 Tax=Phytophthora lilii TaxID=2077276 RepID=A0A9W6XFR5_9STRA|nr:unnamed protein product [Phytophthora lilii]